MKDCMYYVDKNGVECEEEIVLYTFTSENPIEIRFLTPSGIYMYKESSLTHEQLESLSKSKLIINSNKFYKYTGDTEVASSMSWFKPHKEISAEWENVYNIDRICLRRQPNDTL
jgi:hypothetical protein